MPLPLTDEFINALMDHEFAIADGNNPSGVSLLGVAFMDTQEIDTVQKPVTDPRTVDSGKVKVGNAFSNFKLAPGDQSKIRTASKPESK